MALCTKGAGRAHAQSQEGTGWRSRLAMRALGLEACHSCHHPPFAGDLTRSIVKRLLERVRRILRTLSKTSACFRHVQRAGGVGASSEGKCSLS